MNDTERCVYILQKLIDQVENEDLHATWLVEQLDAWLNDMHGDDAFGTEGQCDPRGDFRDGIWSIWDMQDFPNED